MGQFYLGMLQQDGAVLSFSICNLAVTLGVVISLHRSVLRQCVLLPHCLCSVAGSPPTAGVESIIHKVAIMKALVMYFPVFGREGCRILVVHHLLQ